jgi:hypothetical protein
MTDNNVVLDATTIEPQNDEERTAATYAILTERERLEQDALVDSLSVRERRLIDAAWDAGANAAQAEFIRRLDSPHAVTLDAESVRQVLRRLVSAPRAVTHDWARHYKSHYDERLTRLVRIALRELEHHKETTR